MCTRRVCRFEARLKSSWTHLITLSRNFVKVRWRSLFLSTSLGKRWLLTTLHSLLGNVLQTVDYFEISFFGAPFWWLEKYRNRMGRDLNWILCPACQKVDRRNPIRTSAIWSRSRPMRFSGFPNHENGAPRQILKWSTVCSTFSRSGWSVVRNASLAKGGTSKKRPSPHLHKVSTRSNKLSPRTFQTALIITARVRCFIRICCFILGQRSMSSITCVQETHWPFFFWQQWWCHSLGL
jgi:hypothetical protein